MLTFIKNKLQKMNGKRTNQWFYSEPHGFMRVLSVYVTGDRVVVVPFLILVMLFGFWSVKIMFLVLAIFYSLRAFGEMQFWFHQQFHDLSYRPYDFGFEKLDNKAVYIIHQLISMCMTVIGISCVLYILNFIK